MRTSEFTIDAYDAARRAELEKTFADDAAHAAGVLARREHVRKVRAARTNMRRAFFHARTFAKRIRAARWDSKSMNRADVVRLANYHAAARELIARLVKLRAEGDNVPRGMLKKEAGQVWANQGMRTAECLAVRDDRALIAYGMPAGRVFYWDIPAALEWEDLAGDGNAYRLVRNVSAAKPAKRWAADVARYNRECGQ